MDTNSQTRNNVNLILETITSNVQLKGLKGYLADLFSDLVLRAGNANEMLGQTFFQDFLQLPLFISQRIFTVCDKSQNGLLKKMDFVEGLSALYAGTIDQQVKTAFQILDFNDDGCIEYDDVLLVLCHFHFLKQTDASIEELAHFVEKSFNGRNELDYDSYIDHIATVSSDFLLLYLFFISRNRPYYEDSVRYYSESFISSNSLFAGECMSPTKVRRESKKSLFSNESTSAGGSLGERRSNPLLTPPIGFVEEAIVIKTKCNLQYCTKFYSPSKYMLKYLIDYYDIQLIDDELEKDICLLNTFEDDMSSMMKLIDNKTEVELVEEMMEIKEESTLKKKIELKVSFKNLLSGSCDNQYLRGVAANEISVGVYVNNNQEIDLSNQNQNHCSDCKVNAKKSNASVCSQSNFSSYSYSTLNDTTTNSSKPEIILFRINKKNKLKKQKLVLLNDTLFFYKHQECSDTFSFKGIISLRSTYVEKCYEIVVENKKYYPFQLISNFGFKNFQYNFLCQTEDDMHRFVSSIRKAKKFQKIQDCYDMKEEIGHGQFGKIHLGVSKLTQEKVAIKILRKKEFKEKNFQMVKNEIDIFNFLRSSSNPYIIKAKDYYETQNTIYLIFEYIPNGNLNEFLYSRRDIMSANELKTIIGQVVEGIKFLHRFGIMHRDLKPDNILVSQVKGKFSTVKIIDFGLSKICGKKQRSSESFGSLCFTGPEVFLERPYDHRIDVWSLGVIVYYLKYAVLPFDDISNQPKAIVKKIISNDVKFPRVCDSEANDFEVEIQTFIKHCLVKNFEKRISINEITRKWVYL